MSRQTCTIHLWEKDGELHMFVNFDPSIEHNGDSSRVPGAVEACVNRMIQVAKEASVVEAR